MLDCSQSRSAPEEREAKTLWSDGSCLRAVLLVGLRTRSGQPLKEIIGTLIFMQVIAQRAENGAIVRPLLKTSRLAEKPVASREAEKVKINLTRS